MKFKQSIKRMQLTCKKAFGPHQSWSLPTLLQAVSLGTAKTKKGRYESIVNDY